MPRPTALPGAARTGPAGGRPEPAGVKSARRAIDLIETFAANDDWLTLGALHAATGLPRSSLHGLLRTLHESGWLETDGGGYRLGVRALICGTAYLDRDPVIPYATEALETVRDKTGFTAHYARRDGDQVVYLETRESRRSAHLVSRVGRTLPTHATALGKVLLAELTQDEIAGLMPVPLPALTPNTLTTLEALEAACAETRERGYGLETEEGTPGVRCAAAVIPYRIPATDAISCSMPTDQVTEEAVAGVGELLTEVAGDLGRRLRRAGIR
ncbi:IclR family transcriptional regulator [Streptomyces xinghaiensis]|uniref:IclR family transcriptional regulator n=1 Tax=Streptomyces xinghaiensis TaxID=1038928 RepID=UPI002E0FBEB6|nr:IclR family transcriptional regulator [Streptomyces xinghaiensis]